MAEHNNLGKDGEEQAARYLAEKGYCILQRNWRSGKHELDIIAKDGATYVFVEVKTRRDEDFGNPEEAVSNRKIRSIVTAADNYIRKFKIDNPIRFDVVSIISDGRIFKIQHYEEAFFPPIW